MITLTDTARTKVVEFINQADKDCAGLRVAAHKAGRHRFQYDMTLVLEGEERDNDLKVEAGELTVFVDPRSAEWLEGTTIDFVSDAAGTGFQIDNPQAVAHWDDPVAQKVQEVIDQRLAPALAGHGGWVELVEIEGDTAVIEFGGGCQGCGMSQVTLKDGIEATIVEAVPEIVRVVDRTDHGAGSDPYCCG
jgi:Fe/S biogenesis protein NfuA